MSLRRLIAIALLAFFSVAPAAAQTIAQHTCDGSFAALSNADKNNVDYKAFIANCEQTREGWESPPSYAVDPSLAHVTGICVDNNYTTALVQANACTHDGGISAWFAGAYTPPQQSVPACEGAACEPQPQAPARHPRPSPPLERSPPPIVPPTAPIS
jgi:hypothetical protein